MKTKILALITSFIFCTGMGEFKSDDRILFYENYVNKEIFFPKEMKSLEKGFYLHKKVFDVKSVSRMRKLSGIMYDFLFEQDIVSQWREDFIDYWKNREKYINYRKNGTNLYYWGKIKLNQNFDSHLFLSVRPIDSGIDKNLFLINSIDGKIKSITRLAYYSWLTDEHQNTTWRMPAEILDNNIFLIKEETFGFDHVLPNGEIVKAQQYYFKFTFDDEGYVKILENSGGRLN